MCVTLTDTILMMKFSLRMFPNVISLQCKIIFECCNIFKHSETLKMSL